MKHLIILIGFITFFSGEVFCQTKLEKLESMMSQERIDEARFLIDPLLEKDSLNPKLLLYKGMIVQHQIEISHSGDRKKEILDSAYFYFKRSMQYDDLNLMTEIITEELISVAQQYAFTGMELFNAQNYESALAIFERNIFISMLPSIAGIDTMMYYNAALAAEKSKDYATAEYYYNCLLEFYPKDWNIILSLAQLKKGQGKVHEYVMALKKNISLHPEALILYNEIIGYYLEKQMLNKALNYLDSLIIQDPLNDKLFYLKGSIYQEQGRVQTSDTLYLKCLELNPYHTDAAFNLAASHYNKALDLLDKEEPTKEEKKNLKEELTFVLEKLEIVKQKEAKNQYVLSMLMTCYQELGMRKEEKELLQFIKNMK